jgi:hypothetical protein
VRLQSPCAPLAGETVLPVMRRLHTAGRAPELSIMEPWAAPSARFRPTTPAMNSACRPDPCSLGLRRK